MKNIKNVLFAMLATSVLVACKKMDLKPYDSLEKSESFKTVAQARFWDTGIYALLKGRTYGAFVIPQDVQVDQLNATSDFGNRNGSVHRMDDVFLADDGALSGTYQPYYSGINNANEAIIGFNNVPVTTPAQADSVKKYLGDAHLARAYYYHQLALRFCKDYTPATATTDLGMPIVLTPDLNFRPDRGTLKQTFDQIIADIDVAKTNLATKAGVRGASRFTIDAALALEARVKLDAHDFAGAYTAATTIINKNIYTLYNTAASLQSYWYDDARQEDIVQLFADKSSSSNTNSVYLGFSSATSRYTPDFLPTKTIIDLYEATDLRKDVYFQTKPVFISAVLYSNSLKVVHKFPGNPALFTTAVTNYQHKVKLFRIAEQYLIAAEAAYMKPASDEVNARLYLNALRVARGLTPTAATGAALLTQIQDERQRELAFEGFRLFDLKRWGMGVKRGIVQNIAPLANAIPASYTQRDVPASYPKLIWGIPSYERVVNPKVDQNIGW